MVDETAAEEVVSGFFPASREDFVKRAGEVACVTTKDFEDEHTRRHLSSFQKSMTEWQAYEVKENQTASQELLKYEEFVARLLAVPRPIETNADLERAMKAIRRVLRVQPSKAQLGTALERMRAQVVRDSPGLAAQLDVLARLLLRRAVRTASGVAVVTVLTSPGKFSCRHDCYYCPNEPGQPRSYLSTEPAVLRGNQCVWDPCIQFWDRARTLHRNGHTVDKVEILVLGGTWSGYSEEYQEEFCRDLFYAANEFPNVLKLIDEMRVAGDEESAADALSYNATQSLSVVRKKLTRQPDTIEAEQRRNESAPVKVIGLTLETRPDYITLPEIQRLRKYGCTRVQLGVQHTNADVLAGVNRGHTIEDVRKALRLLKACCYKVDVHLMPDLPHSSPELDERMFDIMLTDPSLQADQWKIYPCEVTPFTQISEWYRDGKFVPYSEGASGEHVLVSLILRVKYSMHPWIRLNRVIRDIPNESIIAGNSKTNLRQLLSDITVLHGWRCPCMRCREIRLGHRQDPVLVVRAYSEQGACEYFLSFESADREKLYGFLRLRVPDFLEAAGEPSLLPARCALIRELHVYGLLVGTMEKKEADARTQHSGLGSALLTAADVIACAKGATNMAVIAGVGTRNYYRRFGFELWDTYMLKGLDTAAAFERWHADANLGLEALTVEHVQLEELPSVASVSIDMDLVAQVLDKNGGSARRGAATSVSPRAFLAHWRERISVPKMSSAQELEEVAKPAEAPTAVDPQEAAGEEATFKLTDPTVDQEPDAFAPPKEPQPWWPPSAIPLSTLTTIGVASVGLGLAVYLGVRWKRAAR